MPQLSQSDMLEATRLTREGRLEEAMAVLQGRRPSPEAPRPESRSGRPRSPQPLIEMEPPTAATGGAWTAPASGASGRATADLSEGVRPPDLRGVLGRFAGVGSPDSLTRSLTEGLAGRLPGQGGRAMPQARSELPPGASFEEAIYVGPAGSRPYKLFIPSGFDGQELPLLVMLHGCTQSPDDFAAGTRMNELAQEIGFLVVYPGQTQAANMQKCWNWFNAADQQRDRGEPSLIAGITRTVMDAHPVAPGRVYVAGLSAGGAKAAIMGVTYPDLFAAVGVHSGLACGAAHDMPSAFAAMRQGGPAGASNRGAPVPTIIFHGDRDATVHPVNADAVAQQAGAAAAHRTEVTRGRSAGGMAFSRTVHRAGSGPALLEQWVLHGAGHAWSGGSPAGSYTDPQGPDASREMVRFFLEHEGAAASGRSGRAA